MFETLATLVQPWADFYSDHSAVATAVLSVHILAMFLGGGMAIGADRGIIRAVPGTADAARAVVADLATMHTIVISALVITMLSGAALFLADVPTFSVSVVYWTKMGTVAALLINGLLMRRGEDAVLRPLKNMPLHTAEMPTAFPQREWAAVRRSAAISLFLWMTIVLLSVILTNA